MERSVKKNTPTYFPLGFGIGGIEDGHVFVVEFYDGNRGENDTDTLSIIGSFALTAKKAKELSDALQQALSQSSQNSD